MTGWTSVVTFPSPGKVTLAINRRYRSLLVDSERFSDGVLCPLMS